MPGEFDEGELEFGDGFTAFVGHREEGWVWRVALPAQRQLLKGVEAERHKAWERARAAIGAPAVETRKPEPGTYGIPRSTTSSKHPGRKNKGATYARKFEHPPLDLCHHGQRRAICSRCSAHYCGCPGSPPHVCEATHAAP